MSWEAPQALGGPVLAWELARGARQTWLLRPLRNCYTVWLVIQWLALFTASGSHSTSTSYQTPSSFLEQRQQQFAQQSDFLDNYRAMLLQQQLIVLLLLTPALTAGSLGQEKERGTLFALFGTELTSRQIVLGKLLGRLALLTPLALTALPALVLMSVLIDRPMTPLLLALAQEATLAFTLGAACLLFAIWIRRASDAILASYVLLGLAYLASRVLDVTLPLANWLDPVENLHRLLTQQGEGQVPAFLAHLAAWACGGVVCLVLAAARLRRACLEQGEKKPSRRLWAFRPPVGDNPIRWRERYVIGLAPLPFLRVVPRWLALLAVFIFSSVVAALAADSIAPGFVDELLRARFASAFGYLNGEHEKVGEVMPIMGMIFIFLAEVLVGVRCGTSVAEEKRRKTWDDLLLTAQSFQEITKSKMWGVLTAAVPYVIVYAVPVFALASVGGPWMLLVAGFWVVVPCVAVFVGALMGMEMLRVPPDMDETRMGGAFFFEREEKRHVRKRRAKRRQDPPGGQ